jgi:hypothetical protein
MTQTQESPENISYNIPLRILTIQQILSTSVKWNKLPEDIVCDIVMYLKWEACNDFKNNLFEPNNACSSWNRTTKKIFSIKKDMNNQVFKEQSAIGRKIKITNDFGESIKKLEELLLWIKPYIFQNIIELNGFSPESVYWAIENNNDIELTISHLGFDVYMSAHEFMSRMFVKHIKNVDSLLKYHSSIVRSVFDNTFIYDHILGETYWRLRDEGHPVNISDRKALNILLLEKYSEYPIISEFVLSLPNEWPMLPIESNGLDDLNN